jgi:hypothetical protein
LVERIPWPYIQWASALILSWADAWLSANFKGTTLILFLWSGIPFTTNHDFGHILQDTVPAPRARIISYNVVGQISALGFKSTTLAQLMSRYATVDPTLISSTSDKRKALTLVTPPAAKKKRTTKKVPIEVRSLLSWTQDHSLSDKFHLVQF